MQTQLQVCSVRRCWANFPELPAHSLDLADGRCQSLSEWAVCEIHGGDVGLLDFSPFTPLAIALGFTGRFTQSLTFARFLFSLIRQTLCCRYCSCFVLRSGWLMPLVPAHYYTRACWPFLSENGKYQNAPKRSFRGVNPQEAWDQSCTSVVVWLVFSLPSLLASEHRWRFICCLFPLDSFSFSIPTPPPPQEPVCQSKPCTSPCAYQTVYPFPVGAVLHLWPWQPIATPRVHSKPWFRHTALPALLDQPPLPPLSCEFFTRKVPALHSLTHKHTHTYSLTHAWKQAHLRTPSLPYISSRLYTHR